MWGKYKNIFQDIYRATFTKSVEANIFQGGRICFYMMNAG